jgi:hypothetical protein
VRWIEEGRFRARHFHPYGWWKIDKESFELYLQRCARETDMTGAAASTGDSSAAASTADKEKAAKSARLSRAGNRF